MSFASGTTTRLAWAYCLMALACVPRVSLCSAAEVYDSGWAVSDSQPGMDGVSSVLGRGGVRVDRVLSKRDLENLKLPADKPAADKSLKWRRVRTAQRPGAKPGALAYPPLPLKEPKAVGEAFESLNGAKTQIAPESQAVPEEPAQKGPGAPSAARSEGQRAPALFHGRDAKPLSEAGGEAPHGTPNESGKAEAGDGPEEPVRLDPAPQPMESTLDAPGDQSPRTAENETVVVEDSADPDEVGSEAKESPAAQPNTKNFVTPKEIERARRELPPLTKNQMYLRRKMRSVLSYYYRRPLNSVEHDAWEVMHSMLSYGLYSRVQEGGRRGKPVTAVGFLCFNKPCQRHQMFYLTPEGTLDVRVGVGEQGHKGQLLAMLAQCNVSPEYPIRVEGRDFTIRDLIASELLTCYERSELTFKLIGLMHYLPSDSTWVNDQGQAWDFPKLIADERTQKIRGAACGGTHRLAGLTLAVKKRRARGEPVDGEWLEAEKFVEEHQNYAFRLQNRDGSLSTEWFRGPGAEEDIDRRIRTTGHTLEWLIYTLEDEELNDPRVFRAVNYLTNLIMSNTSNGWEVGPLSHALHALLLYDQRVFQPYDDPTGPQVAGRSNKPVTLNYTQLGSSVSENYAYVQERHEERVAQENSGLGGLFGFGKSNNRRSR